jgi:hypothetical protein
MADNFRAKVYLAVDEHPFAESGEFREAVEAIQWAEDRLKFDGEAEESFAEILWNGSKAPHSLLKLIENGHGGTMFGIWNSPEAQWPVVYADDDDNGTVIPEDEAHGLMVEIENARKQEDDNADSTSADEKEEAADTESEGDSEEFPEDEKDEDDPFEEDEEDDEFGDDEDETEEEDDEDDDAGDSGEENSEKDSSESEGEEEADSDSESEEVPRVKLFGKFKGPKGWRKRAETDTEAPMNVFKFVLGKLDEEEERTARQEKDKRVVVEFKEVEWERESGELRVTLPEGVEFHQNTRGQYIATVPYE